jgi:hypothetical protein
MASARIANLEKALIMLHDAGDMDKARIIGAELKRERQKGPQGPAVSVARGATTGLTNLAGAPVDLAAAALSSIGGEPGPVRPRGAASAGFGVDTSQFRPPPTTKPPPLDIDIRDPVGGSASIRRGLKNVAGFLGMHPKTFAYDSIQDLRPQDRPFAIAGEPIGGFVPFAALPFLARGGAALTQAGRLAQTARGTPPASQMGPVAEIFDPIVRQAKRAPGITGLTETTAAVGAGIGGGGAELAAPGNPYARLAAEIVGGTISPAAMALRTGASAVAGVKDIARRFTGQGKEQKAAEIVQGIVRGIGDDPAQLARELEESIPKPDDVASFLVGVPGRVPTTGTLSGNPILLAVERKLARDNPQFAFRASQGMEASLQALRKRTEDLYASGNPEDLRLAAVTRDRYFKQLLDTRVRNAQQKVDEIRSKVASGRVADSADISKRTHFILADALKDARKIESEHWGKVEKDTPLTANNVIAQREEIYRELLSNETLPEPVDTFIRGLSKETPTTSGDLLRLRSRALVRSRSLRSQGEYDFVHFLDEIAEATLKDLDLMPGAPAEIARNFSRNLHDKFTRTFGGEALRTAGTGAKRISPELMLDRGFMSGGPTGELRFRQLREAADFGGRGTEMSAEISNYLAYAARQTMEGDTVSPVKLQRFLKQNDEALQQYPDLKAQLKTADDAQVAFRNAEKTRTMGTKAIKQKAAFSLLAGDEVPSAVIRRVFSGATPVKNYRDMAKLAKRSGPEATAGLRTATIESAITAAQSPKGDLSFNTFRRLMTSPIKDAKHLPSRLELMKNNGVMTAEQTDQFEKLLERSVKIENSIQNAATMDSLIPEIGALTDFIIRVSGAKLATRGLGGGVGGESLIVASAGSKAMRRMFDKVPNAKLTDVLIEAAENPRFTVDLLKRPTSVRQARALERQINAYLINAGITPAVSQLSEDEPSGRLKDEQ